MTVCEWEFKNGSSCKRNAGFTVMLQTSRSPSNIFFTCWEHVRRYRNKKFIEQTFGKGAKVDILTIGKERH